MNKEQISAGGLLFEIPSAKEENLRSKKKRMTNVKLPEKEKTEELKKTHRHHPQYNIPNKYRITNTRTFDLRTIEQTAIENPFARRFA